MFFNGKRIDATTIVANESYDIEIGGGFIAIQEAYDDIIDIENVMCAAEAACVDAYVSEGAGVNFAGIPVVENALKNIWDKIVSALKSLWEKLKGYFKTALKYFDAMFLSAKNFAEKYENELRNIDLHGFKHEMFEYTIDFNDMGKMCDKVSAYFEVPLDGTRHKDDLREVLRKSYTAINGTSNSEAFERAIYKSLRNNKDTKREITPDVSSYIKTLKDSDHKELVKEAESVLDETIKEAMEEIEDQRKEYEAGQDGESDDEKSKRINNIANAKLIHRYAVESKNLIMKVFNAYKSALSERDSAYKSCIAAALHYKAKR